MRYKTGYKTGYKTALWMLVLLLITLLVACSSSDPAPDATLPPLTSQSAAATSTLEPAPCDPGAVIKVGVSSSPPFVMEGAGGPAGFDVDLLDAVAQQAGLQVAYEERPWPTLFDALERGELAAAAGAITILPDRPADFTRPYFETGQVIAVRTESEIQGPVDLAEREVGVQENTTGQLWCEDQNSAECVPFSDIDQAFDALVAGDVAAVVHDKLISVQTLNDRPELDVRLLDQLVTREQYGIAVRQGCPDLLEAVDAGLASVMASETYAQVCQTHFGTASVCLGDQAGAVASTGAATDTPTTVSEASSSTTPTIELQVTAPSGATASATPEATTSPMATPTPAPRCKISTTASDEAGQFYQIQAGDSLSAIAERTYGNPQDYRAIVYYTNQKCGSDATLHCLDDPSRIGVGWTLYLPTPDEVGAYWAGIVRLPQIDWGVTGEIYVTGSSTVYLLTQRLAYCFWQGGFEGDIVVESTGTGGGFQSFCQGDAVDIVDASRPIDETEMAQCQATGRQPVAFQVGTDAIAVVVSDQNTFVDDVTLDELQQILATATLWSDVRQGWPAEPIERYYPTADSGTFDIVVERLFDGDPEAILNADNIVQQTEDDAALVAGIQASPHAVGFFGYAYYRAEEDVLRALPVDGIVPKPETVDQGTYPLVRPLFIYTSPDSVQKPQVQAFINFYLQRVKHYVTDVGYFLPPQSALEEAIQTFETLTIP